MVRGDEVYTSCTLEHYNFNPADEAGFIRNISEFFYIETANSIKMTTV